MTTAEAKKIVIEKRVVKEAEESSARVLGYVARINGLKCIPAHDPALELLVQSALKANDPRRFCALCGEWMKGWHEWNLALDLRA